MFRLLAWSSFLVRMPFQLQWSGALDRTRFFPDIMGPTWGSIDFKKSIAKFTRRG
jgi:hypothetical protein